MVSTNGVLGLIFADGAVEDVRQSSRTCYVHLSSKDKSLLKQVLAVLSSNHSLYRRDPCVFSIKGRICYGSEIFYLRIGNKVMFQDLLEKGVKPRKSLTMKLPNIPEGHFSFFLRGYFDGDGCVHVYVPKRRSQPNIQVIFTSGSLEFLKSLMEKLNYFLGISRKKIFKNCRAFRLSYKNNDSLKILAFIYKDLSKAPYLKSKYAVYKDLIEHLDVSR